MIRRIAIVGLGRAAQGIHLPALGKVKGVECIGGCDIRAPASSFAFPVFETVDQMLRETSPDMVIVATPPGSHFSVARQALINGCHVLCEKPFTETLDEADELVRLAQATGLHIIVNSEFPWMAMHSAAKRRMAEPGFGKLEFLSISQNFVVTPETEIGWRGTETRRTFKEFGTHVLDLAMYFFDETPRSIRACMPRLHNSTGTDRLCIAELEFSGGRHALILLDRLTRGRHRYLDLRLDGSEATIETCIGGRLQVRAGINPRTRRPFASFDIAGGGKATLYKGEHAEHVASAPRNIFADATAALMTKVIDDINRGYKPPSSGAEARRTLHLLLTCYEAAENGRTYGFE